MMHLKRRIFSAAAVVLLAAALILGSLYTAGAAGEDKGIIRNWFDRDETIYFWYTDDAMTNFISGAALSFGEQENVHVIPVLVSPDEYLENVNSATLKKEQYPDAFIVSHDNLEKAYLSGLAAEITDENGLVNANHYPAAALSAVTYNGKKAAYPLSFETSVLIYNESYLMLWAQQQAYAKLQGGEIDEETGEPLETPEEVEVDPAELESLTLQYYMEAIPATIDDILNVANTFDVPEGVEGVMKWDVSEVLYNYWIVGDYMVVGGENGDSPSNIKVNSPEAISCLETYAELNQFFNIEADTVTYESVVQDFIDGKTVFTIASSDIVEKLRKAKESGDFAYEYGAAVLPAVSEELGSRNMSVTQTIAVNGYSEHIALANRFAAYLAGECSDSLYAKSGRIAAKLTADADNGMLSIFKLEYADSAPLPKMMSTGNYWLMLESLFAKVWKGQDVTSLVQELEILLNLQAE